MTQRLLSALLLAFSAWYVFAFLYIALYSLNYPYNLEWMEGHTIDIVQRIVSGKPIYAEPTIEYISFIYPPLYYYAVAALSPLLGVEFFPARLLSLVATLATSGLIYAWIRKENGRHNAALIGAGFFFGTYELSARWFDIARVDSLFLCLTLGGLFALYHYRSWQASILSGALLAAAFFTKQPALIIALPAFAFMCWQERSHGLLSTATFAVSLAVGIATLNYSNDGWFNFYIFTVPAGHEIDRAFFLDFWIKDMFKQFWPCLIVIGFGWWALFVKDRRKALAYLALAAGCIAAAYGGRLHRYGWTNVLLPMHALFALCAGLSLIALEKEKRLIAMGLLGLQMGLFYYNPNNNIPSEEAKEQGDAFMQRIAKIDGEVFIPEIQFVQTRIGKTSFSYGMAAVDILRANITDRAYVKDKLRKEMTEAISQRRFAAIITSGLIPVYGLRQYYHPLEPISYPRKFVSGFVSKRPMQLLIPFDNSPPNEDYSPKLKETP